MPPLGCCDDALRAELAAATPHLDLAGFEVRELEVFAARRVAEAATCEVVVGQILAELRTRNPGRDFTDICRAVGVSRRTGYRWSGPFDRTCKGPQNRKEQGA